ESFFNKQRPIATEGVMIEKPNAVMIGLEGSARGAPVTQPDQIRAHLLFAQFVRRPLVMGRQPANRLDVNVLAPGCQPRQGHVLDHPASQWRHRHLPSLQDRPGPTDPARRRDTLNCSNQRCRAEPLGEAVSPMLFRSKKRGGMALSPRPAGRPYPALSLCYHCGLRIDVSPG